MNKLSRLQRPTFSLKLKQRLHAQKFNGIFCASNEERL